MSFKILVYIEVRDGKLKSTGGECLAEARKILGGSCKNLHAILLGSGCESHIKTVASWGAEKIYVVSTPETDTYQGEPTIQAIEALVNRENYNVVVGSASPTGRELFPRLAVRLRAAMLTDVVEFAAEESSIVATIPLYLGKCLRLVRAKAPITCVTLRPNVRPSEVMIVDGEPLVEHVSVTFNYERIKSRVIEVRQGKMERPDLTEANIIVSGGRALGSQENFNLLFDCADVIHASVGASRAAVDLGYVPYDLQVGQTGKTVNPKLYIAFGISGSIQHLSGMRTSKCIVAVNTDPDAPIFQKADYGIVADLFEALPIFTDEFKKLVNE